MRCGSRAADSVFGSCQEEWKGKGKSIEMKRTAQYARWPLAANVFNKTSNYKITFDTSKKDKTICNIFGARGPIPDFQAPVCYIGFLFPLDGTLR